MTHLAQRRDEAVSSRDIAERYGIPKRLLAEVMKDLVHRGLVRSVRGATGGYRLANDPVDTTVLSVLQALEGPFEMVPCASGTPSPASSCELLNSCPIKGPIHRIHDRINQMLANVTVHDLSRGDELTTLRGESGVARPATAVTTFGQGTPVGHHHSSL